LIDIQAAKEKKLQLQARKQHERQAQINQKATQEWQNQVEEPTGFIAYQLLLQLCVVMYLCYNYFEEFAYFYDRAMIPLQFFLFTFFRKELKLQHGIWRSFATLFIGEIGGIVNYFLLLGQPVDSQIIQSAIPVFLVVFTVIYVLGKDKDLSINHYLTSGDRSTLFFIALICLTSYALCLVQFVKDFKQAY
jgi:hypothetical protein